MQRRDLRQSCRRGQQPFAALLRAPAKVPEPESPATDLSAGKDDLADSNYSPSAAICFDFGAKSFPGKYLRKKEGRSVPLPCREKCKIQPEIKPKRETCNVALAITRTSRLKTPSPVPASCPRGGTLPWETSWGHHTALGGFGGKGRFCTEG